MLTDVSLTETPTSVVARLQSQFKTETSREEQNLAIGDSVGLGKSSGLFGVQNGYFLVYLLHRCVIVSRNPTDCFSFRRFLSPYSLDIAIYVLKPHVLFYMEPD